MSAHNAELLSNKVLISFREKVALFRSQNKHLVNPEEVKCGIVAISDPRGKGYLILISSIIYEIYELNTKSMPESELFAEEIIMVEFHDPMSLIHIDFIKKHLRLREKLPGKKPVRKAVLSAIPQAA